MESAPAIADWRTVTASKRDSALAKIPQAWLLPDTLRSQFHEKATTNVLSIPRESGIMSSEELAITEDHDATSLILLMSTSKLKAVDVVTAFCKRAAIAQQCTFCLTEIMFDEAIARAEECDEYLSRHGSPMGPFHGLPISLKDSFAVTGTQSTIGFASFIAHPPAAGNSVVVDYLAAAGAIFHCKTNLPQTMMTADSHNNIFGRTLNPFNLSLTAGGSTGGEAALIAMCGSVVGLATDIAGSSRIPALCCGNSSIKPTAGRLPFAGGAVLGRSGSPSSISAVIGVCGRSVRDYELVLRTVVEKQPWLGDENALNVPWRSVQSAAAAAVKKKLRFGLVRGCKERPLHPPIARSLHNAATKLKAQGHEIVLLDEKIPSLYECAILAFKYFMLDPQKTVFKHIAASGEPLIPSIATAGFKELNGWEPSLDKLWDMNVERGEILKKWHDIWVGEHLDAILMPGYQGTAQKHDTYGVPLYTVIQNLLNYPSGILPNGVANKELDKDFFKNDVMYEPPYDADAFEGAPAHVQITGKPMMDEELLEIMKVVEAVLKQQ